MFTTNKIKSFASLAAFSGHLANGVCTQHFKSEEASQKEDSFHIDFTGTINFSSADSLMTCGDKESASKIKEKAGGKMTPMPSGQRTKYKRDFVGCKPNVAAYNMGLPKQMFRRVKREVPHNIITIIIDSCVGAAYDTDTILKANVNIIRAILDLEKAGVKVNLYASCLFYQKNTVAGPVVKIKDSNQPFNLLRMAYPLVHPSFLRRHAFRYLEITPGLSEIDGKDYGFVFGKQKDKAIEAIKQAGIKFDAYLSTQTVIRQKLDVDSIKTTFIH